MAARWSDKSWTDADAHVLLQATVYLKRYSLGHEHFAHLRPLAEKWTDAAVDFIAPQDGSRARARHRLQSLAREIASSDIDWSQDFTPGGAAGVPRGADDHARGHAARRGRGPPAAGPLPAAHECDARKRRRVPPARGAGEVSRGPRIGRPDRLALYDDATAPAVAPPIRGHDTPPLRSLLPRPDRLRRFLEAPDVAEQLERLPAALDELAKRLAGIISRARAGRLDVTADAAAVAALDALRDRAWELYVALGRQATGRGAR
jgi:hypothetical protein